MTASADSALRGDRAVTSTDALKAVALLLILFDHWAYYIQPDQHWMQALGRGALPIFFFLLGFAATRAVPWFWLAAGAVLTALDLAQSGGELDDVTLNILFSFAIVRLARPWVERHVMGSWWRLGALVVLLLALSIPADRVLEYGTSGWMLALVGLAHRRALDAGPDSARNPAWLARRLLGAIATLFFIANEIDSYGFETVEAFIAAGSIVVTSALLLRFRRVDLPWPPPRPLAALLRFCGRRSLEIYIAQILVLMALGLALGIVPAGLDDEE